MLRKDSLTEVSAWIRNVNQVFSKARVTENWRAFGKSCFKWLLSPSQFRGPEASQHFRFQIQIKAVCDTAWTYILTVPDFKILLSFINSYLNLLPRPLQTAGTEHKLQQPPSLMSSKGELRKVTRTPSTLTATFLVFSIRFLYQCSQVQCCFCGPELQEAVTILSKSMIRS